MSDAISHAILLGIVLAFFVVKDIASSFLIFGATLVGLLTVWLTELLTKTKKMKEDASIGLVFPMLFSIAVILITKFASHVHLDSDAVLLGEIGLAPFHRFVAFGTDLGPVAIWIMGSILLLNLIFILLFYKELKLTTFDPGLAVSLGFSPAIIHYLLMSMVSVTAVGAFNSVGSILVVALIVAPPSTAYLLTHRLSRMISLSCAVGIGSAISGYYLARHYDASIAGSMAMMAGLFFLMALLFAPQRGLLAKVLTHRSRKLTFASHMLAIHLLDHEGKPIAKRENTLGNMITHMNWSKKFAKRIIVKSQRDGLISVSDDRLFLTELGRKTAKTVMLFA